MELWDLYDKNRNNLGRTHTRGVPMEIDTYHLVVNCFIINSKGELLVSQRHPNKTFPLQWEGCGGSVTTGEDSYMGALREMEEELGLIPKSMGIRVFEKINHDKNHFNDTWFFQEDIPVKDLKLQEIEVVDAKWVNRDELFEMFHTGEMINHLSYVLEHFYENFIFTRAKEDDIPYLLDLREKTMNPHLKTAGMPTDKFSNLQRINYHFDSGKIVHYKGEKIGFLKYTYETYYIHLIQIQIDPKFQNRGFGKKLLDFVKERAIHKRFNIRLEVLKNSPAKKLYESFGFRIIDEDKFSYEMELTIND